MVERQRLCMSTAQQLTMLETTFFTVVTSTEGSDLLRYGSEWPVNQFFDWKVIHIKLREFDTLIVVARNLEKLMLNLGGSVAVICA